MYVVYVFLHCIGYLTCLVRSVLIGSCVSFSVNMIKLHSKMVYEINALIQIGVCLSVSK